MDDVLVTVRSPDGRPSGSIVGLVVRESGLLIIIDTAESIRRAAEGGLRTCVPGDATSIAVRVVDGLDGARQLWAGTDPGDRNDLYLLPIWCGSNACWVNPLRPRGPRLADLASALR